MKKFRVIFMGTPYFAKEVLIALHNLNIEIIAVISQPDSKIGRKQIVEETEVKKIAKKMNLNILQPQNVSSIKDKIKDLKPDFIITCAYGQFIPNSILNIPILAINIHASYLPYLRGGAPIHWAVINGDKYSGITIMKMVKKMDAGPIFVQRKVPININDTTLDLRDKLINLSKQMIKDDLINIMDGKYTLKEQDETKATFGMNITRDDEKISFDDKTIEIYNKIRGLYDVPGAYSTLNGIICKIYKASYKIIKTDNKIKNGTIIKLDNEGIHLKLKDGIIILKEIQLAGKKIQQTKWFYKNAPKNIYIGGIYE